VCHEPSEGFNGRRFIEDFVTVKTTFCISHSLASLLTGTSSRGCIGVENDAIEGVSVMIYAVTHRGLVRKINEDRFVIKEFNSASALLAVADGLGGHAGGEIAADIAAESLKTFKPNSDEAEAHLIEIVHLANRKIMEASEKDAHLSGMGTTLTAAFFEKSSAHWIHLGDSRLYLYREGELVQVTDDQTVAGLLHRAGEMNTEEAKRHPLRNMLTNCLGRSGFEMDVGSLELTRGDLLLLSTDGLHDHVEEEKIVRILRKNRELKTKLDALLQIALDSGGGDNITAVALQI
jgi:PPM family protein phosphatase